MSQADRNNPQPHSSEPLRPLVPPPVPAPYLAGLPGLSAAAQRALKKKRPTPAERALIRREQRACEQRVIAARLAYQDEHGVEIKPEPGTSPFEASSR